MSMHFQGGKPPPNILREMAKEMMREADRDDDDDDEDLSRPPPQAKPMQARVLKDMLPEIERPCPFQRGDIVEQVKAYQAYNMPAIGSVGIVTAVLGQKMEHNLRENSKTPREDMVLLVNVPRKRGGAWVEVLVESWRFKRYEGPIEE